MSVSAITKPNLQNLTHTTEKAGVRLALILNRGLG